MKKQVLSLWSYSLMIIALLAVSGSVTRAQYIIIRENLTPYVNDSAVLYLENIRGSIQWQVSDDLATWKPLTGMNRDSLSLHIDSSAYYRAAISEGTCDPLYSDTVLIAELYDERDRQFYDVVSIGIQWWMADNLNFDAGDNAWFYHDRDSNGEIYGRLYNWQGASSSCPSGWHLPSDREWMILERSLGIDDVSVINTGWRGTGLLEKIKPGGSSGFDLLYSGYRAPEEYYSGLTKLTAFWTSGYFGDDSHWYRGLSHDQPGIHRVGYSDDYGMAVRCVKNSTPLLYTDSVNGISDTSAIVHGIFIDGQGSPVTFMGICWDTHANPAYNGNYISVDYPDTLFSVPIPYLSYGTTYYVRTYAVNALGVGYGNTLVFNTQPPTPVIYTSPVVSITTTSARSGGNIANSKGLPITARGVCWSKNQHPTVADPKTSNGSGAGSYTSDITALSANTQYYLKAYVTTPDGTFYGNEISFKTPATNETGTVTDTRNGKTYKTVKIGYQWWMAQNLSYTTPSGSAWYKNDSLLYSAGGRLYDALTAQDICITGWHLPSEDEWALLETTLGMDTAVIDITGWRGTNQGAKLFMGAPDGFDAEMAGLLAADGKFYSYGTISAYWSSTEYESTGTWWYRGINTSHNDIHRERYNNAYMHSVRCVRNEKPQLITDSVGSITEVTAAAHSRILSDGGRTINARGVCWSKNPNPTSDNAVVFNGTGNLPFVSNISGLEQNTVYYLRAYATNSEGMSYGNEITFITLKAIPVVTTTAITSITSGSAEGGGTVLDSKGFAITARGVCWNTTSLPTISNAHTTNGSGNGSFISTLTDLQPNTTYYVRAYATSVTGTGYGNELIFKTSYQYPVTSMTDGRDGRVYNVITIGTQEWMAENLKYSMAAGSNYYNNDSAGFARYGRLYTWDAAMLACPQGWHLPSDSEWKTLEMFMGMNSATADIIGWRGTNEGSKLVEGGTSGFEALFGGQRFPGGNYANEGVIGTFWTSTQYNASNAWYRGFNISHSDIHRDDYSKTYQYAVRCMKNSLPLLTTSSATGVTDSSAYSGGNITYDGGVAISARGVCWSLSHNPTITDDTTSNGSGTGTFVSYITGLQPGKTYYIKAYATNAEGTTYGNEVIISTLTRVPVITTAAVTSITDTSAVSGGNVTSDGGLTVTARGVCWSLDPNPVISNDTTRNGTGTGIFSSIMRGLLPNTTYFVKAYATNSKGTGYGNQVSLTTQTGLPKVITATVTSVTDSSAASGGNVTSEGGLAVTVRGICWSTSQYPTVADDTTRNGSGSGTFVSRMKNLQPNVTYYVRAYAINSKGAAYGNQVSFLTSVALPVISTTAVTAVTSTTASSGGNISSNGGSAITARGVCWNTLPSPTIANSKTSNGTGTGSFSSAITVLARNTTYYVMSYATNAAGTAYGEERTFTTLAELPMVSTTVVTGITDSSASSGGQITDNGGSAILSRGVCWSTSQIPTVADDTTLNGNGSGSFSSFLTGLADNTLYYVRAYAVNSAGVKYGNQQSFTTSLKTDSVVDARDGQVYTTVKIGTNWWMAENIDYNVSGSFYYDDDSLAHADVYGRLYTWSAMMSGASSGDLNPSGLQGICPAGWHLPGRSEWSAFIASIGGSDEAGGKLKETGTTHWDSPNTGATNETGFNARPAGLINWTPASAYLRSRAYFWLSTEIDATNAYAAGLARDSASITEETMPKDNVLSVRCVKD